MNKQLKMRERAIDIDNGKNIISDVIGLIQREDSSINIQDDSSIATNLIFRLGNYSIRPREKTKNERCIWRTGFWIL
jgi:hypothetical protein